MGMCADNSKLHSENNNTMQYAVVTGANQGIGKAIAAMLLENGCNVAVCARNYDKLVAVYRLML
jgi:short-subunit dehydrogenase